MIKHLHFAVLVVLLVLAALPLSAACVVKTPLQFVSLVNENKMQGLENINQMQALCGKASDKISCVIKAIDGVWDAVRVYQEPAKKVMGAYLVSYTPELGITTRYLDLATTVLTSFQPFIYDNDWGYGPWAHEPIYDTATVRGQMWVKVRIPIPDLWGQRAEGWIKPAVDGLYAMKKGSVVSYRGKDYVIASLTDDDVVLVDAAEITRAAGEPEDSGPACMDSDEVEKTIERMRAAGDEFLTLPFAKTDLVYDSVCQPRLTVAYTRGC